MKKEINSKSKRKWVAGGLAAFASIALLTTGFATWVVGQQKIEDDDSVTVNVDTAHNESVEFTVELPSAAKIELKEGRYTDSKDNRIVLPDNELGSFESKADYDKACLTISNVKITIKYGSSYDLPANINFSISEPASSSGPFKSVKVASENNKFSDKRDSGDLYYLDAPASISTQDTSNGGTGPFTKTENGTIITLTYTTALEFTWGNFFKNKTPAEYYNTAGIDAKSENYDLITAELAAMNTQLHGQTINLHAELGA
ncbi:MAG: hypothetical protein SPD43_04220 [Candidatus Enterosoma sp.]|nr:hypothetical protein [Candidatus Enterosoma sp.]